MGEYFRLGVKLVLCDATLPPHGQSCIVTNLLMENTPLVSTVDNICSPVAPGAELTAFCGLVGGAGGPSLGHGPMVKNQ